MLGQVVRSAGAVVVQLPVLCRSTRTANTSTASMEIPAVAPTEMTTTYVSGGRVFAVDHEVADCAAIIVTYNSAADIGGLLGSLPAAAAGLRIRVVVVDNASSDDIASIVARYPGV